MFRIKRDPAKLLGSAVARSTQPLDCCECRTNMYTDEASQMERLEFSFIEMQDAGWDTDGVLLWGYFFVDPDVSK